MVEKRVIRVKKVKNAICGTKVTISTSNLYIKNQFNHSRLLPSFGYGIPNLVYADPNIHGHDPSQLHCKILTDSYKSKRGFMRKKYGEISTQFWINHKIDQKLYQPVAPMRHIMKRTQKIVIMSLSSFFSSVLLLEGIFMAFIITCMHCIHHHVDQIIYIEKIQENVTKRTILNACIPINFSKQASRQLTLVS